MRLTQRLLTTLAVATCALSLFAADASALGIKKGIKGGLNLATVRGDDADSEFNKFRTGFAAGLALEFALPVVAVEVDVLYAQRGAKLEGTQSAGGVTVSFEGETINNYIDVPVVAKLSVLPTPVLDVNVQLGASFAYLLSSKDGDGNEAELDDANRLDVGVVAGLGAKISAAVADVTIDARYTHSLSKPDKDGEVDAYNRSFMVLAGVMF